MNLKQTFLSRKSSGFREHFAYDFLYHKTGIPVIRLQQLANGFVLSDAEYARLGRCPAAQLPHSVVQQKKLEVLSSFNRSITIPPERYTLLDKLQRSNFEGVQGSKGVLRNPAQLIVPYIRLRADRLLVVLHQERMIQGQLREVIAGCLNSNFTSTRFVATILGYISCSSLAREELLFLLSHGGYEMNSHQWTKAAKKHHDYVKTMRRCFAVDRIISGDEMADMIYANCLAGRDYLMTEEERDEEADTRVKVPPRYLAVEGSASSNDVQVRAHEFASNTTEKFVSMLESTGQLGKAVTWQEFNEWMYVNIPGGSCSLRQRLRFGDFGVVQGQDGGGPISEVLRGNKRLRAELDSGNHFRSFGSWVVTAFLKYEAAKNRWLYPSDYDYVKLGLYIMNHMRKAYESLSGVDFGHDLNGSVATKLDVLEMVGAGVTCLNTDGSGFNEEHHKLDMFIVYDVLARSATGGADDAQAYDDLMHGIMKYKDGLESRSVILPRMPGITQERRLEIKHTLFSGEATTQMVNTTLLGGIAMEIIDAAMVMGVIPWVSCFWKGDDLNCFLSNWLDGVILMMLAEQANFVSNSAKDHIEPCQCEHERCIVTPNGYHGSLWRRVGSGVAAEPQGAAAHTLEERLTTLNEFRMAMMSRGAPANIAMLAFRVGLATYLEMNTGFDQLLIACGYPKANGGYGLWKGYQGIPFQSQPEPPQVQLRFRLRQDGLLGKVGSANMTDGVLTALERLHRLPQGYLQGAREEMIGDHVLASVGPRKYGNWRRANSGEVLRVLNARKFKTENRISFPGAITTLGIDLARAFGDWLDEPMDLRHRGFHDATQLLEAELGTSRCLTIDLYCRIHGVGKVEAYQRLTQRPTRPENLGLAQGLWRKDQQTAVLLLEGDVKLVFVEPEECASVETIAVVTTFVLHWMAVTDLELQLLTPRTIARKVELTIIGNYLARQVWLFNHHKLRKIMY
jgi:hypothetical protein